jgi:hypothetical protein
MFLVKLVDRIKQAAAWLIKPSEYERQYKIGVPRFPGFPGKNRATGDFAPRLGDRTVGPEDSGGVEFAQEVARSWKEPLPPEPDDPTQLPPEH